MKKLLIIVLIILGSLTTCLVAQHDFTFSGGINLGSVVYDSGNGNRDTSMKPGLIFGIEMLRGPIIIGAAYVKRGGNSNISSIDYSESISLDYLTGYVLLSVPIVKDLSSIFGCQFGECMGGIIDYKNEYHSGSVTLYTDAFKLDFGILLGADYMFSSRIGVRTSYYAGFTKVFGNDIPVSFNNSGIGICILCKI